MPPVAYCRGTRPSQAVVASLLRCIRVARLISIAARLCPASMEDIRAWYRSLVAADAIKAPAPPTAGSVMELHEIRYFLALCDTLNFTRAAEQCELAPVLRAIVSRGSSCGSGSADVEDVVQDILLAIHLKRHTWDERRPLLPWVRAIARNKFVDNLRKRDRHVRVPLDDIAERLADTRSFDDTSGIDVSRMLATLKKRQRQIVQAISIEGTSASQIAGRLAMTEGAVRVALHRALHSLAKAVRNST